MSALAGGKANELTLQNDMLNVPPNNAELAGQNVGRVSVAEPVKVATQTLAELIQRPLAIPEYQRRYCWGPEQVALLLEDIGQQFEPAKAKDKDKPYVPPAPLFLGTLILHQEADHTTSTKDYLVDGQQRCLTLVLLLHALGMSELLAVKQLLNAKFPDSQSQQNLAANFKQIQRYLAADNRPKFDADALLDKLQFVVISISSIDQAFAFFDSQNTSGKRLSDFDLLKARHLRAVVSDDSVGIGCSHLWEAYEKQKVGNGQRLAYFLTEQILARTRIRQRGKKVDDLQLVNEFAVQLPKPDQKSAVGSPKTIQLSPPTAVSFYRDWQVRYEGRQAGGDAFTFTTQENRDARIQLKETDLQRLPLQLNQPLLGGEQFFFYIGKYTELYKQHFPLDIGSADSKLFDSACLYGPHRRHVRLLELHRAVEQGQSAGYSRLIEIWLAMLLFYLDRFADDERFDAFAALADQYVFSLRISAGSLRRSTVENHFKESEIFDALLQCASSMQAVALIEKLSEIQAKELLKFKPDQVVKTRQSKVIRRYLNVFFVAKSTGLALHSSNRTSLAAALHANFFKDEQYV
jgi:hypothetical protein